MVCEQRAAGDEQHHQAQARDRRGRPAGHGRIIPPMAEFSSHVPGTFSWVELATTDRKAGVTFYRALFGWDVSDRPIGPNEIYSMFQMRGKEVAAAYTQMADERRLGVPSHWNVYISVESA